MESVGSAVDDLKFEIIIPKKVSRNANCMTTNGKNRITIGVDILKRIGVTADQPYVRFAKVGSDFYVSNKPEGTFGYAVKTSSNSSKTISNARSLIEVGLNKSRYDIGELIVNNENNWYKLIEVTR